MKKAFILLIPCLLTFCTTQKPAEQQAGPANIHPTFTTEGKKVVVYTTADTAGYRLTKTETLTFRPFGQPLETQPSVFVDPSHRFQTMLGIGGAFTDAAAETFAKLPAEKQQEILNAYYDQGAGIGYTWGRIPINSTDFSSDMYTYVADGDKELKSFDIAHDEKFKLPMVRRAMEAAGGRLDLFVSPWSLPAWMKDNNSMLQGGTLLPEFYRPWANYFIRYIRALESTGIPVWGLSVQNEPMAKQTWESCIYTAEQERDFIRDHLGPVLHENGMAGKKLIAWDHNRDLVFQRANTILGDPETAKYVWGIGFHWYELWNGGRQYENIKRVAEAFPGTSLLLTEACNYPFSWDTFNDWKWGEQYGENMINDFNNGAVAWTDWNLLLDETGGPNHVQNWCFAPVHAKTAEGTLHYMNSYYYIGHFSKFIRPGAARVTSSSSRAQLLTTAFINPDGKLAVVVMNETAQRIPYRMYIGGQAVETVSLGHSIQTLVVE